MAVSAAALRAGQATIELSLLQKTLGKQLGGIKSKIQSAFKGMAGRVSIGPSIGDAAAKSSILTRTWGGLKNILFSLPAQASKLRGILASLSSIRFSNILNLRSLLAGTAITAAVAFPVKLAANIELATAQMEVFTGSAAEARKMLMELLEFSSVAGQSPEMLAEQARLLMTRDIKPGQAVKDVEALAVFAAGSPDEFQQVVKAFADVKQAGRMTGEEMRQFKNTAFSPLDEIMKHTGETALQLKDRLDSGGVSFEEVAAALHASVRQGGRFHGMLEKISGTLIGKMRMAFAQLKLAILPFGDVMLGPFKLFFDRLSRAMPGLKKFIEQNKNLFASLSLTVIKVAAMATLFIGLSVVGAILGTVISGLTVTFAALLGIIGFLLTPLGWFVIAMGYVIYKTLIASGVLKNFAVGAMRLFGALGKTLSTAFQGLSDALSTEDFKTAMEIVKATLSLLWLQTITELKVAWINFKDWFLRTMQAMVNKTQEILFGLLTWFRSNFPRLASMFNVDALTKSVIALGLVWHALDTARRNNVGVDLEAAWAQLKAAEDRLKGLAEGAAENAKIHAGKKDWFGDKNPFKFGAGAVAAVAGKTEAISTFDTSLVRQMFGKTNDRQLDQLKKIEKNTRAKKGGGLPVI
jgi:hypothetical protein